MIYRYVFLSYGKSILRILDTESNVATPMAFRVKHQTLQLMWFSLRLKQFFVLILKRKHIAQCHQNLNVNFTNLCVCCNIRSVTFEDHNILRAFSLHIVANLSYPVSDLTKNLCTRMKSRLFTCSSCLVLDHTLFKRLIIFFAKILFSADRHQITYLLLNGGE